MNEFETLERHRSLDLLRLRDFYRLLREFEEGIATWEAILNDPQQSAEHEKALKALEIARRGKAYVTESIEKCINLLSLLDENEELLRQLESL